MITFITNYDASTASNHNVIHSLIPNDGINLIGQNASRQNLTKNLLDSPNVPVFVITHGYDAGFYSGSGVVAFSISDRNLLNNRRVFVYACYTANQLGRLSSNENCIYWGYTGAISALIDEHSCIDNFREIFQFIIDEFFNQRDANSISLFIQELKNKCEIAESNFDIIGEHDASFDLMSVYNCTKDIWNRLRVFLQNENVQLKHPEAEVGDLFQY